MAQHELVLNDRELCDLELLLNGGFAPLTGYLKRADYESVLSTMRLSTGELWSMPITLSVESDSKIQTGDKVTLKDQCNNPLAVLSVEDRWTPDLEAECVAVYGCADRNHEYINITLSQGSVDYLGGPLELIQLPLHYDFKELRRTPEQTRQLFQENGWKHVIGFQTRNPMHRSHMELTLNSVKEVREELTAQGVEGDVHVMIHPVVGVTQSCDVNYHTRVRCYKKLLAHYPENVAMLSLLPLSMRMAGPREALWHALIRKNYGCTHFVVGRDHAGPSFLRADGEKFFGPYDAHNLLDSVADEIGIKIIKSVFIVYEPTTAKYYRIDSLPEGTEPLNISGTEQRRRLRTGEEIPEWFSYPDVVAELRKRYKPLHKKGFCVYFTGLSGAGKSTVAQYFASRLREIEAERQITVLDGDVVRQNLSKGLGFSRADRSTNVRRIGYVASEIVKHGGIVLCANIAPYADDREHNRNVISAHGGYFEVHVATSLNTCEQRDIKGLYEKARAGIIKEFTGISDPYEAPESPELSVTCDTMESIDETLYALTSMLRDAGYLI